MLVPPVVTRAAFSTCHPERSEGSGAVGSEMLRCAQHDSAVPSCHTAAWVDAYWDAIAGPRLLPQLAAGGGIKEKRP
jgi:hypothetical protein